MIPLLARLTGLSPALARAALWAALIAALVAAWGLHQLHASSVVAEAREAGVAAEREIWLDRVEREERRQDGANANAIAGARAEIVHLRAQSDALAGLLEDMTHEADASPDRDRIALPADSVRRIAAVGRSGRCEALRPAAGTPGPGPRSGATTCRAMTVSEVEDGWRRDRATIVEAQRRDAARRRFYEARDGALKGGQPTGASPGFSPVK